MLDIDRTFIAYKHNSVLVEVFLFLRNAVILSNENEIRWKIKQEVLTEMSHFLCNTINPRDYYSFLRSRGCLTRSDQELIETEKTTHSKVQVMLDILMKKGSKAFDDLCDAILGNRTQTFIVTELNKCYERKCQEHLPSQNHDVTPDDDGLPLPRIDIDELIKNSSCA